MRTIPCLSILALAALASSADAQTTLVAPGNCANLPGNSNNSFPWNRGVSNLRIQFVYDSSVFTSQGISGPVVFTKLRFRPYSGATTNTWTGGTWSNVHIDMATSAVDYTAASATFANNLGLDAVPVYAGPVSMVGGGCLGTGIANNWYIDLTLFGSFVYDPTTGNDLVLDIQLDGAGWTGTGRAEDVVTGAAAPGCRIWSTDLSSPTGSVGQNHMPVTEFTWTPAVGLFPNFGAALHSGLSPLVVQFTDATYSSAPGGVLSWRWDFDSDGIVDSTLRNPTWVFPNCGDYSVALTVTDANSGPATRTRANYVRTDLLQAGFTVTPLGNRAYQFTDTSTPTPNGWAWDFDGDGLADSTVQNPNWQFGTECSQTVRMSASLNCRLETVGRVLLQAPASLSANLAGTSASLGTPTAGCLFDVLVGAPEGVSVCGLSSLTTLFAGDYDVDVYVTPGGYLGRDANASVWRHVAHGRGNAASATGVSVNEIALDTPFYLPPGNHGIAVYHTVPGGTSAIVYNTGALGPFANAELTIHPSPATAPGLVRTGLFAGTATNSRQWNGTFHYTTVSRNQQGGHGTFGLGCAGSLGVPGLSAADRPRLGTTLSVTVERLPLGAAVMMVGFSNTSSSSGPLPYDLTPFGAPGCLVRSSPDATLFVFGPGSSTQWVLALPADPTLLGMLLFQQALAVDPAANALGVATSDAAAFVLGL